MKLTRTIGLTSFLAIAALAGCEQVPVAVSPLPVARPDLPPKPSARSEELRHYYARLQTDFLTQGLLRNDGGGPDVPFSANDLAKNFMRIAFFNEFSTVNGRVIASAHQIPLLRWDRGVRINVEFGETVGTDQRRLDQANVTKFANRLTRVSGHSIRIAPAQSNFHVLILNEDERLAAGPRLRAIAPSISPENLRAITHMPQGDLCLVHTLSSGQNDHTPDVAIVVVRAEHPDLLRLSCLHEEMAQGLGLGNDSPTARPSIFNDDEEFALLTTHDELLLKMLYDPRLTPGMTATEARPIVEIIARELRPDASPQILAQSGRL